MKYLKKVFGFESFKGNQEAIIRNVLAENDTFVIMPTGGGKSLVLPVAGLICRERQLLFLRLSH